MIDNDAEKKETIFRPRAANTLATLMPKEVTGDPEEFKKQYLGDWNVQKTDLFTEHEQPEIVNKSEFRTAMGVLALETEKYERAFQVGKIIPVDNPKQFVPTQKPLEERVQKLEEQVDSLLDRIARYNQRAQHRI